MYGWRCQPGLGYTDGAGYPEATDGLDEQIVSIGGSGNMAL